MSDSSLFEYAELAEASYADFASLNDYSNDEVERLLKDPGRNGGFSQIQAAYFVKSPQ